MNNTKHKVQMDVYGPRWLRMVLTKKAKYWNLCLNVWFDVNISPIKPHKVPAQLATQLKNGLIEQSPYRNLPRPKPEHNGCTKRGNSKTTTDNSQLNSKTADSKNGLKRGMNLTLWQPQRIRKA